MALRPYQQEAVDAAMAWLKVCIEPAVLECPTGSGKSHIAAGIAHAYLEMCKGTRKVLVTAPTGELVEQNYSKWLQTGEPASVYSASVGRKEMRHPVIFGTPGTVVNGLTHFAGQIGLVIMDEAHGITPTMLKIIGRLREGNKHLRVIGMSATPFRLGSGYIFERHYKTGKVDEGQTREPFFKRLIYSIDAHNLITQGYLTPPQIGYHEPQIGYDTSGLTLNKMGQWDAAKVDQAFVGRGRLTSQIVADVVEKARGRMGVMFFAATIQHAKEIMESLPPHASRLVTGENSKADRAQILEAFQTRQIKYLVNVAVLTTGFDAPHVDTIAVLRATESAGLLLQIIGRGLRLHPDKTECMVLDYAENIERHAPHGDIFDPAIKAIRKGDGTATLHAICPVCSHENIFSPRSNDMGYLIDETGYFKDLAGNPIAAGDGVTPMPAHFGRRCEGESLAAGIWTRCGYRWSCKICPECEADNDIAARYCRECKAEIIDPNEKLKELETKIANDPYGIKVGQCVGMTLRQWPGKDDKPDTVRVDYQVQLADGKRSTIVSEWLSPNAESAWAVNKWHGFTTKLFGYATNMEQALEFQDQAKRPDVVSYQLERGTKFVKVKGLQWAL